MRTILAAIWTLAAAVGSFAAGPVPARVFELARGDFAALGRDPVVVAAVRDRNAQGLTLDQVKEIDARWMATPGVADFMKALIDSPAGRHLRDWKASRRFVSEVFIMDRLGANVAMTEKTSDYWQGDEEKFTACCKGEGEVFIGPMTFDESTQTYSVHVSVPVLDGAQLIGAICIGIDVEKL